MASHRFPVLSDDEWIGLLSDVLEMQQLLFKCVSQEDCYEIVLQSLLCCGKCEGITLAGKMMECNNKQRREKLYIGPQSFKLPYAKSVQLVLAASREYFNSSANASDPCMALARMCLNLIEDVPARIEEELDLISAISLLQEFNVNALPLQVRLCENRLALVQEVLQKKDKNYKKSAKIMKLAYLLRAGSTDKHEREGKVLTLIGERAFQCKDYKECLSACKQLMAGVHKEGWMICYALGECNEFDDIPSRSDLLSFSLVYCSDDLMETILKSRTELQLQVLQGRVKYLMGDDVIHLPSSMSENFLSDEMETDINGMNPLWHTGEKTFQILQNTTRTTKTVFKSVKTAQFWKDAVNWIQPLALTWEEKAANVVEDNNKNLSKQGICAFYDGLVENAHLSALEANYQRFARPDLSQSQEITLCITRAALLEDSLKFETAASSLEASVLLDLAKACLSEDIVLSLCILLCLKKPEDAEMLFKKLPSVPLALQFASLYYALRIYRCMGLTPFAGDNTLETDPAAIIRKVLDMKNSKTASEVNKKSWDLLEKYNKLLYDFIQAEILHSIGGGVDATRFTKDDVYKKDTILGISMTLDDNVFHTAVSLAHHYSIPLWDLYMTHLEYLFSEISVSASVITERIQKLKLKEKLLEQMKSFEFRLRNCVYPNIDGRDHDKLHLYFSLLEDCGDYEDDMKLKSSLHKKLLNKLRGAMKGIDYKMVMSPESSSMYLASIINESNVHVFAKVASSIPKEVGVFYEPGNMYCLWVQKYFFEGKSQNTKIPVTKTDWIHRYESCTDMLQKLGPSDVLQWVDRIIFSPESLENMSIDCRSDIVKRILKFYRMKSSRHKGDFDLSSQWSDTAVILNQYHQHLQRLDDETLVQLRESYDPKIKDYCKAFDLTKSSTEKLKDLLVRIVLEGPDLQLLKTFLSCCPSDISWEPADAYIKAINVILLQLKQPQNILYSCFKTITPVHNLEAILEDISKEKEELMIEDLAVEILNEFCQDADILVSTRLSILQLLEKTHCLSPEYGDLLLLYRTQAVVTSLWPNLEVSKEEVKDEFQRKILFDTLLSMCRTVNHFIALAKLLNHWPAFSKHEDWACTDEPWAKLLCGLIALSNKDALNAAVSILEKASVFPSFNEKCSQEVFKKIQENGCLLYTMKYALKTDYKTLHDAALNILKDNPKITCDDYDDELLDLILKHNLISRITSSGLYKPVIEFLLHCQDDSNIQG
ncbi:Neuroblastoma-amplified sequence, partial [Stegodyphus mimosarum]